MTGELLVDVAGDGAAEEEADGAADEGAVVTADASQSPSAACLSFSLSAIGGKLSFSLYSGSSSNSTSFAHCKLQQLPYQPSTTPTPFQHQLAQQQPCRSASLIQQPHARRHVQHHHVGEQADKLLQSFAVLGACGHVQCVQRQRLHESAVRSEDGC